MSMFLTGNLAIHQRVLMYLSTNSYKILNMTQPELIHSKNRNDLILEVKVRINNLFNSFN